MEKQGREEPSSVSGNGFLWLAVLAAGAFYFHEAPWKDSRPSEPATPIYHIDAAQNIDARLWQDPIGAVARGREEERRRASMDVRLRRDSDALHKPATVASVLCDRSARGGGEPIVLGAMVLGGPYPEYSESRRRARYAVLAAMNESGFAPANPEHIGYIMPESWAGQQRPEFIAYEWLFPREWTAEAGAGGSLSLNRNAHPSDYANRQRVLLLWLDSDVFGGQTNRKLVELVKQLHSSPQCPKVKASSLGMIVLGPGDSMMLRDLVRESSDVGKDPAHFVFYDYAATAEPTRILKAGTTSPDGVFFQAGNFVVLRTIGTDAALAKTLHAELKRRGAVTPPSGDRADEGTRRRHIVMLSEWDSLYGQTLPEQMARELSGCADEKKPCSMADIHQSAPWIHTYSYLRGLDGQLPVYSSASSNMSSAGASGSSKADSSSASSASRGGDEKRIERPEGQSQYDYLRRLAKNLYALQSDLQREGGATIGAIGVLGNDVYDKLLILEALRPLFPTATFFTTDLDARLLHPQELQWTRNLIVASNFGLSLHPDVQADIPPFRDGYQTSLFLATRIALINAMNRDCGVRRTGATWNCLSINQTILDAWQETPRLFEIGRNVAFDLSEPPPAENRVPRNALPPCKTLQVCRYIHAMPSPMYPAPKPSTLRIGFAILVVGSLLIAALRGQMQPAFVWLRGHERPAWNIPRVATVVALGIGLLLLGIFLPDLWTGLAERLTRDRGMPISLAEGVSIWPSEVIRLMALGLSIWFIYRGWRSLNENADGIAKTMLWQPERAVLIERARRMYTRWPLWKKVIRIFSYRLLPHQGGAVDEETGLTPDAQAFWMAYIYQSRGWARFWRVTVATLLYLAFGFAVSALFGFPESPHRGDVAEVANKYVTFLSACAMLTLIFFVVDATALTTLLIGKLRSDFPPESPSSLLLPSAAMAQFRWPQRTLDHYAAKLHIDRRYVDQWIAMHFIARRTRVIVGLVYYPFIVLSLMVFARSPIFDNWTMPIALIIVLTGSLLIVVACAVVLRWAAEITRRKAAWRLNNEIVALKGTGEEGRKTAEQLQVMIEQIRNFRSGAFAPYGQQPVIRALLLPLTSYGGGALLQYLTLTNF